MEDTIGEEKTMFGVEYRSDKTDNEHTTFEIFETLKQAREFAKKESWLYIFKAIFNTKFIWKEDNDWNYDDNSALMSNAEVIEEIK